ncbi:PEP-CTERM sorting domain-containing protein [Methylophilus sp. 5]|uniref:PEP-CTERM sorting domain-containing protein n=1 Tax=Methylophilus sp. 5 TaxID=1112274 RepID=UPI00056403B4|nr:PEP-CTERM sorting domain-containing protein [Methylophilus sp. 5]
MKNLVLVAAMGLASVNAYAVDIVGLYNTGASFSAGAQDTNYALSSTTTTVGSNGYVTANGSFPLAGNWLANTATSSWLTPTASQGETLDPSVDGLYTWTTTFDLTGYDAASASFNAQFAADNSAIVYLNGNQIGTSSGFSSWSTFSATAGNFVAGVNTLSFVVTNQAQDFGNPTGLRVEFLTSNVATVPEADTYALMLAGFGLMGLVARRKNTA